MFEIKTPQRKNHRECKFNLPRMLANSWKELNFYLDLCCATNGVHIQLY